MTETRSTCPYCGIGCGVVISSDGGQISGVRGDPDHPANFGRLCSKGSTLHLTATQAVTRQTRLLQPMQRLQRGQAAEAISWDGALGQAAKKFADTIHEHGPDAVGFYISGQLLTEDYYVFNKLAKGLIGTNNIDSNSRLCMSSAVAGYKQTLGADAPPACYDDVNHAACLFIAGSNTAYAHPILFRRIEDARRANPASKVVVVDPRRTETAAMADLHLQLLPGTDVMLFNGLLNVIFSQGWADEAYIAGHTNGIDALRAAVRSCTPERVAQVCGLQVADIVTAARWFAGMDGKLVRNTTLSLYCQGLNQSASGTAKNAALINLHLATGQIGRVGAGPFSLTGQPNAMGGREVGGMANLLSGHRDLNNAADRNEVAALWGVPDVPFKPGKTAVEMFQAAADGEIKALWIACTNPAQSMPDQATVRRALQRAEFVVVQEAFATAATCAFADLLLPATTWGEKDGTVTNSERCITRVHPAVPPPGKLPDGPRHDWTIAADFARHLAPLLPPGRPARFAWPNAEAIWNEHRESTRGRDLDITGLSYALLDAAPAQWPFPAGQTAGKARLYEDGIFPTPDGRARFAAVSWAPVAEPVDLRHPFALTTGRLRDHWHGMTRTGTLGRLFGQVAEPAVQMHGADMARRSLSDGDLVHVTSRRGSILLPVQASDEVAASQAFIPMHWGGEYLGGRACGGHALGGVNALTSPAFCPDSKQPELKHAAVRILKADLPWSLLGMAWLPEAKALAVREALKPLMAKFSFAACVPFGRERTGVLFRAASDYAADEALLLQIEDLLGIAGADVLRYADKRKAQRRSMLLHRSGDGARLEAFLLAGDISAQAWIRTLLVNELPAQDYGRLLLAPGARAPVALKAPSRQVCTCFNVSEDAIREQLTGTSGDSGALLERLQGKLKCGTNCGSCLPELRRLVQDFAPAPAVA
ncbi:MAG: molybdopterin-dependent oxidoreductase [Burkholderiaceae bacterium]|nr:molybdopterin-dependent oxidoreductase [Burkholderiaceae bacterium]